MNVCKLAAFKIHPTDVNQLFSNFAILHCNDIPTSAISKILETAKNSHLINLGAKLT